MAVVEVKVPDIGDFEQVEVIELLVKAGDKVAVDQSLMTVESDKASMEIPSSQAGTVKELKVKIGDKVAEGSLVLMLETEAAASGDEAPAGAAAVAPAEIAAPTSAAPASGATASGAASAGASSAAAPAGPAAASSGRATSIDVMVPDIGDFADVAVIEVMVEVGDSVKVEQSLLTVESDKASMEIPSSHAGVVKDVKVKVGDRVAKGSAIVTLEASSVAGLGPAAAAPSTPSTPSTPSSAANTQDSGVATNAAAGASAQDPAIDKPVPTAALPAHQPSAPKGALPHASPSIRKSARELGVPLDEVEGSGPNGRITPDDLNAFVKAVMAGGAQTRAQAANAPPSAAGSATGAFPGLLPWPQVDFAKFGAIERKDLSRIKKISGANLHRNWVLIPHVTNHDDADITELEAFRLATNKDNEKAGIKVTMLAFLIKATVAALKKFPDFNASLETTSAGEQIVLKKYFHIGFAADTPNGLMVPVIRDCDQKGVLQISQEMGELAKKARDGKLSPGEMSGGCFSISSLGGIGGRYFTPIINAPEVAILGVCKSAVEPVWDGKSFQPRLMLPLSLSWDHRVVDGASAARFNAYLGQILSDFRRVLL